MENKVYPELNFAGEKKDFSGCFKKFLLVSSILFTTFDMVLDIVYYTQLNMIEEGLLIGKLGPFKLGALVLCIADGVILFIEIILIVLKYTKTKHILNYHCAFVVFLLTEELPPMIINFLIVFCSGVPVHTVQMVKLASLFLFALTLFVDLVFYVQICGPLRFKSKLKEQFYRGFAIISNCLYLLCCSSLLFLLVGKKVGLFSNLADQSITSSFNTNNEYNYFSDVGIFINQQLYYDSDDLATAKLNTENNWIQLATINQLRAKPRTELSIVLQYKKTETMRGISLLSLVVWTENFTSSTELRQIWTQSSCYTFEPISKVLKVNESKGCVPTTIDKQIFIKLRYDPPTSYLFYGNVVYKAMKFENGRCETMDDYTELSNPIFYGSKTVKMHYFRNNDVNEISPLKHSKDLTRFFKYGLSSYPDLADVNDIWKTELLQCPLNGVFKPKLDKSISMNCYFQNF